MIKYIGSKRRLVPVLAEMFDRSGAKTALDLFTGTTRVAQAMKAQGAAVTAVDTARYSKVFADCWITTDGNSVNIAEVEGAIRHLNSLVGVDGYFTETFCVQSRFFQPNNGRRIDAIRDEIALSYAGTPLEPILMTALLVAADKVDSTTGVQMAFVKNWATRSFRGLELQAPRLIEGKGTAIRGDATQVASELGSFDLAYLDPPYNQHRYFANYHIWETLVAWDKPMHYGVACKRVDVREPETKSPFNSKRRMADALAKVINDLDAEVMMISYNDESWITADQLVAMCAKFEDARMVTFESRRYVGAQIGVFNPQGEKVGKTSHLRNNEWVVVAGPRAAVARMTEPFAPARM